MKKSNNVIIIGCSIPSLYAGIKLIDMGYKVTIIEKKHFYYPVSDTAYHNFNIYNDNHKAFINLLKKFDISSEEIKHTKFDERLYALIHNVIQKSKLLPQNIIMTHTFSGLCKYLASDTLANELDAYGIFNIINAVDCINMFTQDLTDKVTYYYLSNDNVNQLISKMTKTFQDKYGKIFYNNEVKNVRFNKRKYTVNTNMHNIFSSDLIITTISKDNLLTFGFWNNEQKVLLNSVTAINSSTVRNIMDKMLTGNMEQEQNEVRDILLEDMHIVYPLITNKSKYIYIWNNGINNILIREKIKTMYNDRFIICSESFSKNNMFISYSLEYIDSALIKLYKYV